MEDTMEKRFDSRYEDTFHWIKTKILAGSKKGILNLLFWRLPLIFIEGKVVAAFFYHNDKRRDEEPLLDTIRIPESEEIFKYSSFIEAFRRAVGEETHIQWEKERNEKEGKLITYTIARETANPNAQFDFLDYFGIPCKTDPRAKPPNYNCTYFSFNCFDGCMEIWVALGDVENTSLIQSKPEKKLNKLLEEIRNVIDDEKIEIAEDVLTGHVLKHDIMPLVFRRKDKYGNQSGLEINLSEYMFSAFSVLHESLLDSLRWKESPNRVFILFNSRLFSPKLRFFLTEAQSQDYKKKYSEYLRYANAENEELKRFKEGINRFRVKRAEQKDNDTFDDAEDACSVMKEIDQSGTVSSFFKERGLYEIFLEETTFNAHPVLFKKEVIKSDWQLQGQYSYPEELEKIEPLCLLVLPNVTDRNTSSNEPSGYAAYQFAMIPYFFRGHPFGCIAFFNPEVREKKRWYGYLNRVLNILDENEGTIYQAAIKDLCKTIFEVVERFEK